MNKIFLLASAIILMSAISNCSKKSHPSAANSPAGKPAEAVTVKKATVKTAVPKVIVVNDVVAKRSVDGRYYYDLEGHRYWRNNRDGKYYLYHKGIFDNEDFNPPVKQ
ncbi:MAG: hypothetical protein IPP96_13345 [Chitinophagaceae bacterium]|nr:hypothetical protein [Chitinophagaceae bacterium]